MADEESAGSARVVALGEDDLHDMLALSVSANWNQNEADWRTMLLLGQGWGVRSATPEGQEVLAASTVVLPYAPATGWSFAWVSMVLVLPAFRRRGLATLLLRHALADLARRGMTPILDATPQGHAVYAQEGFQDTWGFARHRREARLLAAAPVPRPPGPATRALRESDWPAVEALDRAAFGADRMELLRSLARRLPAAARVVEEDGGRLRGYVLGRDGREAAQIGPLLADDAGVATSLLHDALLGVPGPVYVDMLDRRAELLPWLRQRGFAYQRPFTRMVHGASQAPGDPATIVLVAGPELG